MPLSLLLLPLSLRYQRTFADATLRAATPLFAYAAYADAAAAIAAAAMPLR